MSPFTILKKPKRSSLLPSNKAIYQGIILSIITQIIDKNLEESYKIRPNGEPDVPTHYEFDEFGNLQFNGKGLVKLPTYLSIGLEQKQTHSLLQVIQQLRETLVKQLKRLSLPIRTTLHS